MQVKAKQPSAGIILSELASGGKLFLFFCGEHLKNKQEKGHEVMVQQNTIVSISKVAIHSFMQQLIYNKCFSSLGANPMAGHTALEDHKAAPANAMSQAVRKPIRAKHCKHCTQGSRDV